IGSFADGRGQAATITAPEPTTAPEHRRLANPAQITDGILRPRPHCRSSKLKRSLTVLLGVTMRHFGVEGQRGAFPRAEADAAVEAGPIAAVAGHAVAGDFDLEQDRILVAIDPELADGQAVAAGIALSPELLSRPAPEPAFAGRDRARE